MKDLYQTLGVAENADDGTIKKAFRKLAKENHPDATGGDKRKTERFKEVNEAYSVLGDAQKRGEYDRLKHAPVRPDGMPEGFDPDSFAEVFGGGGRFGGRGARVSTDMGDMGDLFSSLFGGGGGRQRGRQRATRGQDMAGTVEISFEEAALGTRRSLRSGNGGTVEVQIPPGVDSGGRLRVAGQGGSAPDRHGTPGDLLLDIAVKPHPTLRRAGHDIEMDLPLGVGEAILGAKVDVPTIEGPVTVSVPPGTSSGGKLRLRGKGIRRADGTRGDQMVRVEIVVPKLEPDDGESKKLVEDLARRTQLTPPRKF